MPQANYPKDVMVSFSSARLPARGTVVGIDETDAQGQPSHPNFQSRAD
jgi:hypothetical protein